MTITRRTLLKSGVTVGAAAAVAGCTGDPGDESDGERSGYAAFFTLWDWSNQVGDGAFTFENPVEVGEMGHGWEPDGDLLRNVAGTDVFVYLDTPELSWAQDIAAELEADYDDVAVIDGMAGLDGELLPWDDGGETAAPDRDHDWNPETVEIADFDVLDRRSGEVSAYWHNDHWHGGIQPVPLDSHRALEGVFEDSDGRVLPLGDDDPFEFDAVVADGADEEPIEIEPRGDHVRLHGREVGRTQLVFQLKHDGEVLWDTSNDLIAARVEEEVDEDGEFFDPHVWVDPVLSQMVVDTIAEGLAEIDPDNAEMFEENAAAYNEELAEIDAAFEELMADATRNTGVLAGHDSFAYVEDRYGFDLHTPVGVSPEAEPSQTDIADTIEFVDDNGIDVILYDQFESPNLANTIVENSSASEVLAVTPAEGTTAEWNEEGWGWLDQMREVNLPAFRKALGAE